MSLHHDHFEPSPKAPLIALADMRKAAHGGADEATGARLDPRDFGVRRSVVDHHAAVRSVLKMQAPADSHLRPRSRPRNLGHGVAPD